MKYWILPSNSDQFDVESCIDKHRFVFWKQKNKYEVGDIVFIYCTGAAGKIRYVTVVEEIDLQYDDAMMGFELQYWKTEFVPSEKEMKLRLLQDVNTDVLSRTELVKHGLKSNIQGPMTIKGDLLDYIKTNLNQDTLQPIITKHQQRKMKPSELVFKHRVDKSFLTSGFVISKNEASQNLEYLVKSIENNHAITIVFNGEKHFANFDNHREGLYRMMFRKNLQKAYQNSFMDCYDKDNAGNITTKKNVVINVGFYATDNEYTFEAKQIGETIVVDSSTMKERYKTYLKSLNRTFSSYVDAIDKKFVNDKVKELYDLPSAYYMTDPDDVLQLVDEIRKDPETNEKDKKASSRCPSCSLKKYAEFLILFNKEQNTMPFKIDVVNETIKASGLIFNPKFVERYICSLLTKPFVILSGLTGSGKTQLAMAFPKLICKDSSQYKLIPVGADWTNREQLLGYPNALRPGEYVMPDNGALQLILEASKPENQDKPYFLVLDEMNMSHVERYFADFLSAMESGEAIPLWGGNDRVPATITMPKNLFIIGTINVDETTYMFSPKVLDRANVIEFRINKEQMLEYLESTGTITKLGDCSERAADFVAIANKEYAGSLSAEMKTTLINMFDTLGKIQKEFGYRTAHEMSRYITITQCFTGMSDNESIDSAIVQKLLPKVHGSRKKVTPVLKALWAICYNDEATEIDTLEALPEISIFKYPLTAEKIWRMFQIAQDNGFTSFAEA